MFKEVKNFKKEDLKAVAMEIGEDVPPNAKVAELKNIILNSDEYKNDPDFVKTMLENAISERKSQEENDKEEARLNLEKLKLEADKEVRLEEAKARLEAESKLNFEKAKMEHELELARIRIQEQGQIENQTATGENGNSKRKFTLPKLEFRQFSGDIKEWLAFWSQFQHIHDDNDIAPENKFQYLIQATVTGSRAREVVDSFPPTGANYAKVIESLKARFGREDLLVEVYVRELLKLVISVHKNEKLSMTSLYDKVESHMRALDSLGVTTDKCASILYPMVESCFNEDFLKAWNRHPSSSSSADAKERLNNLMQFIKTEVEGEERINLAMSGFGLNEPRSKQPPNKKQWNKIPTAANLLTTSTKDNKKSCIFCMGKHASADCFSAQKMSLEERKSVVREKQCCFACLTPGHTARKCRAFLKCILCGRKHVPLMCEANESKKNDVKKTEETEVNNEVTMSNVSGSPKVFLQTLKCKLISDKKEILVRVILDTGSSKSYVVKSLAEEMGYNPVKKETLVHSLFGGVKSEESKHSCYRIRLKSIKNNFACNFEALDQVTICSDVSPVCPGPWLKELQEMDIILSDVGAVSHPVDVLIGADIFGKIMTGQRKVLSSGLVAIETLLGWTLLGKVPDNEVASANAMMVTSLLVKDMDISDMWRLDSIGIQDPSEQKTKEELHEATMDHFLKTVDVNEDQRFHVCLPWIDTHLPLPNNFDLALRGLEVTSRKLKNEKLYDAYGEVFNEWEQENIIEEVPKEEMMLPCHYLPHRHVVKENSTTKIRPVFNASSKQKGSPSLNDCVEKGLNLIELIPSIISRFRMFKFGATADIRKAFFQISLNKQDRNFLRFLWYNEDGKLKYYRHCRVVFGVSCSPFLLAATIKYHLETKLDEALHGNKRYPEDIIRHLLNSFYVDNCLISVKSEAELKQFIEVASEIMAERKFDLRGWEYSGPSESIESPTNILGMMWDKQNDTLSISLPDVTEAKNEVITKRNILAASHKVFDPIGITSPVMLRPKLWLQDLWKSKIGWDGEIDSKTRQDFLKWLNELEHLKNLKVPRWLHCEVGAENFSLHFFCDASKLAYSTVAFLRVADGATVHVQLIQSKTRIAPCGKKETTIARLELLGATISARLSTEVLKEFKTKNVYFWTDSTTVLAWLKREDVWGAFVQNRVQEIRQLTPVEAWRHVPGSSNPADLPSRGCSSQQLCCLKWWEGPSWLYLSPHEWPAIDPERDVNEEEVIKEKRKTVVSSMINIDDEDICCDRFSSYSKNIRVLAWSLRFIHNISHEHKLKGNLSSEEFQQAESLFFKSIQSKTFQDDKFLSKMQAFRDENGILRIRTKLVESDENVEFRLPVLLPACTIVEKLIREEHEKAMHAGSSIVLAKLREKFWILRGKKLVKKVLSKCVPCQRYKSRPVEVPFAPLPRERITQTKVFEVSGVDYAGPLNLKTKGKAWIVLFTCAVYRAVHFELVESLSTDAYIQALRRFIARRGRVSVLYSDNGTNFVGTNNALKGLNWEEIAVFSTARKITWKFIPPTAAWWGGWWERMVRMLKELLRRVLGKSTVNYEELNTILCDCEAVINARPLTYLQDDPNDLVPLTPDMFIYSGGNSETPDLDSVDRSSLIKRIKYLQKLRENLRQRFRNEYLALLVHKGIRRSDVLNVGDVVLIGQDNIRRIDWPLGIILEVFPGRDGVPRVARLKTSRGERIRPFQRLYPLEISGTDVDVLQAARRSLRKRH